MKHKRPPTDVWQDDPAVPAHDEALDRLHTERLGLLAAMVQDLRAENERLRAHDADQRAALAQQEGEVERMRADVAALRRASSRMAGVVRGVTDPICPLCDARIASFGDQHAPDCPMTVLDQDHPGAALLAELHAARALRAVVQPLGSMLALSAACAAYDAAMKAGEGRGSVKNKPENT